MRYEQHIENKDGWTDWFRPKSDWRMSCCDCGLVHNVEFGLEDNQLIVRFSRNKRATTQRRRRHKEL